MCGLVGVAGNLLMSHHKMFRDMLLFDTIRGWDSTGITVVPMQSNIPKTIKEIGPPSNLWDWGDNDELNNKGVVKAVKKVLMGHNRAATVGKINKENAHPFTFGNITGAHNGSLNSWKDLEGYDHLNVDSQALFNTIDKKGIDHTWKSFYGAAAITWWDEKKGQLSMVRNDQRPLYIAFSKDEKVVFWASEAWMIRTAAIKHNVDLKEREDKDGKWESPIFQLKAHSLHVFEVLSNNINLLEVRELEKKPTMAATSTRSGGHNTGIYPRIVGIKPKHKNKQINFFWSIGLEKADKEVRGQEVELLHTVTRQFTSTNAEYVVVMKTKDGKRVEVFSENMDTFKVWEARALADTRNFYKILHRPRIFLDEKGKFSAYRINERGVKLSHSLIVKKEKEKEEKKSNVIHMYKHYDGAVVSEKRWNEIMRTMKPTQSCTLCTNPLNIEDHELIRWLGPTTACCPECASNEFTMLNLEQYQYQ